MLALKANQPIRWKERIGIMALGHTANVIEMCLFDFMLYPAAIAVLGTVAGGLLMSSLSASVCIVYIRLYDWSGRDWLGIELLKEVRDGEKQGRVGRFVQRIARKSDWLAFTVLSCYTDPFITTLYLRQGVGKFNGLSPRDWGIFWMSVALSNLWWTVLMTFVVMGLRAIFRLFT